MIHSQGYKPVRLLEDRRLTFVPEMENIIKIDNRSEENLLHRKLLISEEQGTIVPGPSYRFKVRKSWHIFSFVPAIVHH